MVQKGVLDSVGGGAAVVRPDSQRIARENLIDRGEPPCEPYHGIEKKDNQALTHFLTQNGQALVPMVELIEHSKLAVGELMEVLGRASIEAVLQRSAQALAGPPQPVGRGEERAAVHDPFDQKAR